MPLNNRNDARTLNPLKRPRLPLSTSVAATLYGAQSDRRSNSFEKGLTSIRSAIPVIALFRPYRFFFDSDRGKGAASDVAKPSAKLNVTTAVLMGSHQLEFVSPPLINFGHLA